MDMQAMVFGAYLGILQEAGTKLTRDERRQLQEHRRYVQKAAERAASTEVDMLAMFDQLRLFEGD